MRSIFVAAVLVAILPLPAAAQIEQCGHFKDTIDQIVNDVNPNKQDLALKLLDVVQGGRCFAIALAGAERQMFMDFVKNLESSRTDKQAGAGAGAAGSTSVVSQGAAARVLSVAAEYGAVTQAVNGQVITIRGNLTGIPSALVGQNVFPYCVGEERLQGYCVGDSALGFLRRVSFSASFNAVSGTDVSVTPASAPAEGEPVVFEARRNQLAAASVRVDLWNRRDTMSAEFLEAWKGQVGLALDQASGELLSKAGTFVESVLDAPGHDAWRARHQALVAQAGRNREALVAALKTALQELQPLVKAGVPALENQARGLLSAYSAFFMAQDDLIATLSTKKVFALEFAMNRPTAQPHTSNVRLVADWPITTRSKLVANGGLTWYDTLPVDVPPDTSRYRDALFALQLDHGLGASSLLGPATLSLAAYYQYQHAPALITVDPLNPIPGVSFVGLPEGATTVFAEKGHIGVAQVKLLLAPEGSAVKIPLAITYSNRTELIAKRSWRAQVGVAYDFDSLFALAGRR